MSRPRLPLSRIVALAWQPGLGLLRRPDSAYEQNERRLLLDGAGAGIINGVAVFLPVFLVRLGGSNLQVGAISALPALTAVLLSIPVGEFLARQPRVVAWLAWARLLVWASFPVFGLLPFVLSRGLPESIMAVWALATLPQVVHVVSVNVVLSAVVDDARRFRLLSRRWSLAALAQAITIAVTGQVIPRVGFPQGYQLIFAASLLASLLCFWAIRRVQIVGEAPAGPRPSFVAGLRERGQEVLHNREFLRFLAVQFVFHTGVQLAVPLLPIYWVRDVHATDGAIGLITSVQTLVTMVAYFQWTRAARRRGKRWVLLVCCLGLSAYPGLTAVTHNAGLLTVWAGLAGLFTAGVDLTFVDIMMSAGRAEDRPLYVGLYTTSANTAAFLAPVVGTLIAGVVGVAPALGLATGLRLLGFALMILLRVGASAPQR